MEFFKIDYKIPDGKLIRVNLGISNNRISSIQIRGDFFIHPEEALDSLQEALVGSSLNEEEIFKRIDEILSKCESVGISSRGVAEALNKCLDQRA
jgi:lipoate---protein ligase